MEHKSNVVLQRINYLTFYYQWRYIYILYIQYPEENCIYIENQRIQKEINKWLVQPTNSTNFAMSYAGSL